MDDAFEETPFDPVSSISGRPSPDLKTYGEAVAEAMDFRAAEGHALAMTREQWLAFASRASHYEARAKAKSLGIVITWDCEHAKSPDGYYAIRGGVDYAVVKSLAAAPFADLLWMETKTADLHEAKIFADAIHAVYPDKMLAYNLSPSFNWDTTGMTEEQMRQFPAELGKLGFVFNFITYGGHQADGVAAEELSTGLRQDGMLALARLQRKIRLLESPLPHAADARGGSPLGRGASWSISGRTATTKSMGKGSTQFQHMVQIEVPPKLLEEWLEVWARRHDVPGKLKVSLRPHTVGSDVLELRVLSAQGEPLASVVFATIQDRRGRNILSVRDQNTLDANSRRKRLMTLIQLFLMHRYRANAIHFVTPNDDNHRQTERMKARGIFSAMADEVGEMIVAEVDTAKVKSLVEKKAIEAFVAET